MNLKEIINNLEQQINTNFNSAKEYIAKKEELSKKVKNGYLGIKQKEEQLQEFKKNVNNTLYNINNILNEKASEFKEQEFKRLEETSEEVTPNILAEITLLSKLDSLTQDKLQTYYNKYKSNELVVEYLKQIAKERIFILDIDLSKKEILDKLIDDIKIYSNMYSSLLDLESEYIPVAEMQKNGAIEKVNNRYQEYIKSESY